MIFNFKNFLLNESIESMISQKTFEKYDDVRYTPENFKKIKEVLERDAKDFIDMIKKSNRSNPSYASLVFRGYFSHKLDDYYLDIKGFNKKKTRKDRRPTDTAPIVQDRIDSRFENLFGIRLRSNSSFTTKKPAFAQNYGKPYIFFPIGDYRFFYNEKIRDLYAKIECEPWYNYIASNEDEWYLIDHAEISNNTSREDFDNDQEWKNFLDEVAGDLQVEYDDFIYDLDRYQEGSDISNIREQEIMFVCDEYYLIHPGYGKYFLEWLL